METLNNLGNLDPHEKKIDTNCGNNKTVNYDMHFWFLKNILIIRKKEETFWLI